MSEDSRVSLILFNEQAVAVDEGRVVETARRAVLAEKAVGEVSILLVDISRMAELSSRYLDEPGPTDVLAFPIDGRVSAPPDGDAPGGGPPVIIGEVVLCPEVARDQASDGLDEELDLLVVHGVLHLLGYDHDTTEAAAAMRAREE
ncbi:MAG: rRNA maturation RNase YbeY, partial [Actinomycetota bacterium]